MNNDFEIDTSSQANNPTNIENTKKPLTFEEWQTNIDNRTKQCKETLQNDPYKKNNAEKISKGVGFTFLESTDKTNWMFGEGKDKKVKHWLFLHNYQSAIYTGVDRRYKECSKEEAEKIFNQVGFYNLTKCKDENYNFQNGIGCKNIRKNTDIVLYRVPGLEKPIEIDVNDSFMINKDGKIIWCHGVVENRETKNKFRDMDVRVNLDSSQQQFLFNANGTLKSLSFYDRENPPIICGFQSVSAGKRPEYEAIGDQDMNPREGRKDFVQNGENLKDDIEIQNMSSFKFLTNNPNETVQAECCQIDEDLFMISTYDEQNNPLYRAYFKKNGTQVQVEKIDDDLDITMIAYYDENNQPIRKFVDGKGKDVRLPQDLHERFVNHCMDEKLNVKCYSSYTDGGGIYYYAYAKVNIDNIDCFTIGNPKTLFTFNKNKGVIREQFELKKEDFPSQCAENPDIARVTYHRYFDANGNVERSICFYDSKNNLLRVNEIFKDAINCGYNVKKNNNDKRIMLNSSTTKIKLPSNLNNHSLKCTVCTKSNSKKKNLSNHAFKETKVFKNISNKCKYKYQNRTDKVKTK